MPRLVLSVLVALSLLGMPSTAAAAPVLDQSNDAIDLVPYTGIGPAQPMAQSFTAQLTGRFARVRLWVRSPTPGTTLTVQLRTTDAGLPTDTVLASGTASPPGADGPIDVTLSPPAPVTAGTTYALVFSLPPGPFAPQWGLYTNDGQYGSGALLRTMSGVWEVEPPGTSDFGFQTWVDTAPDATPPTTTVTPATAGQGGWWAGSVALTTTATDAVAGVASTRCWVDPATPPATFDTPGAVPCPATVTAEGLTRIWAASRDHDGNAEVPHALDVRIDRTAPTTVVSGVATERTDTPQPVTLTATDAGTGVAATHYEIGADPALPTAASPVYDPAAKPVLRDGERIRFLSVDRLGNAEANTTSRAARVGPPPAPEVRTVEVPGPLRVETRTVLTPAPPVTATASAPLGKGRAIRATVGCGASACTATVSGEVRAGRRVLARLAAQRVALAAGRTRTVRLTLTKAQRAKLGKAARMRVTVRTEGAVAPSVELDG